MNQEQILGIVRHVLTILGGVLVSKGDLEAGQVELLTGAVVTVLGVAWSIYAKRTSPAAL